MQQQLALWGQKCQEMERENLHLKNQLFQCESKNIKKQEKLKDKIEELEQREKNENSKIREQNQSLKQKAQELEMEVMHLRRNCGLEDNYEHRIKQLLQDLERESKAHLAELTQVHDHYRPYVHKVRELEQRLQLAEADATLAQEDQRTARRELVKYKLQAEEFMQLLHRRSLNTHSENINTINLSVQPVI